MFIGVVLAGFVIAGVTLLVTRNPDDNDDSESVAARDVARTGSASSTAAAATDPPTTAALTTTTLPLRTDVLVDPASFGRPWGETVTGLLTFRGNPTRSYHGLGPVPVAPHVVWQVVHGWPTLEFIRNASAIKMQTTTPLQFVANQVMNMNPFTLPVWLAGLIYLLVSRHAARYRPD